MPDSPYTQLRSLQYRGPSNSQDYNERLEENYRDLVVLYNRARTTEEDVREGYARLVKDQLSIAKAIAELEARIATIESQANTISFYSDTQIDNDRFNSTAYNIPIAARLTSDSRHGVLTLPQVDASSFSKLFFVDTNSNVTIPSTLQTQVVGVATTADSTGATIDTSIPEFAIKRESGRIWERNVIVSSPNVAGAEMYLYIRVPTSLFATDKANTLVIHPYPALGTDIVEVAYTTKADALLQDADVYTPLNATAIHNADPNAIGWVPPGGWAGDADTLAGSRVYYFNPLPITGLRVRLRQRNYYIEDGKYVYSYGLSKLDLRYTKFLNSGSTIVRFDATGEQTITNIDSVMPELWNVAEAEIPDVFSYELIWETAYNSGIYTSTPVSNSKRVWVKVNLSTSTNNSLPALSGLTIHAEGLVPAGGYQGGY